ncbi:MAG: hypothetical protein HYS87_02300 [Candidatus Colwellbacteria bacterium]|nr:hypothetical protein [Candidatus Colwellbacteria bacterium]
MTKTNKITLSVIVAVLFFITLIALAGTDVLPTPAITDRYQVKAEDNNKTFEYNTMSRFTILLEPTDYGPDYEIKCNPEGAVKLISNTPSADLPEGGTRFEAVNEGKCTIANGDFSIKIVIVK